MPESWKQKTYGWKQSELKMEWYAAMEEARKRPDRERLEVGPGMPGVLTP
jgi:hypothetical protein